MVIAAAVNENNLEAIIPEVLDRSAGIMIFDCDPPDAPAPKLVTENFSKEMEDAGCEALLCGFIYDPILFESIAQIGITRYMAAGMTVKEAITAMNAYQLNMIPDYVGGPGCSGHGHSHRDCSGDCDKCSLHDHPTSHV